MREILFRGKHISSGEWVRGHYYTLDWSQTKTPDVAHYIWVIGGASEKIDPDTVGQFTGLTDKNGKKIFEGDIVKDESGVVYPVVFDLTGFYLKYAPPYSHGFHFDLLPLSNYWHAHGAIIEVIGNIHDQPELLETA